MATRNVKHPKVSEMVVLSIAMLNDRNGSSYQAIKKYITSNFKVDEKKIATYIKRYIYTAIASGTIIQTKGKGVQGSFRLGGNMKLKMSELLKASNNTKAVASSAESCKAPSKKSGKAKKT
ncbi:late histone H1 [Trichonephila inaurata madagascariensis]|uniref:Late histone H1 n=1 Tax=Trichonephila inaurata madagascariensis TaxID=2747483 RepID=A0A8X6Y1R7_9ARAC|nr:late histone H1 [Trichonephila inaurata madagascariensis]